MSSQPIDVISLDKDHELIKAAYLMIEAHRKHATIVPALEEVDAVYPEFPAEVLITLWVGINAKERDDIYKMSHVERLKEIEKLMKTCPEKGTIASNRLEQLASVAEQYENENF